MAPLQELERFLEEEQGSIDAMLVLAGAGFGQAPLSRLAVLYHGWLEDWQCDEFAEQLGDLLDAVGELVESGYGEDWEDATQTRFERLLAAGRSLQSRLDRDEEY